MKIERYHYALKSGCQVEELQLETVDRLHRALAVYSVVAWRLLYLTYMARAEPDTPCTSCLSNPEWQALYCQIHRTRHVPDRPPTLQIAVVWIARLGGFLARKRDGNPGVKVLWRGFHKGNVVGWHRDTGRLSEQQVHLAAMILSVLGHMQENIPDRGREGLPSAVGVRDHPVQVRTVQS